MNMNRIFHILTAITAAASVFISAESYAQIGPDLLPPGLSPDHPVDSYTEKGGKKSGADDWQHQIGWDLNASDVVFSAAKKRQLISEAPSTIHVITDRDISAHGWRTLAEILRHVPGVQTLTTHSQFQSIMIRGLVGTENNNSRILWLQNGVPMNDVRDSGIWLDETYPVEMIKRIEVVLGPGSALYGSGAFQGVVNIFTKDPADIHKYGEYRLAMQNNLTFKASAIAAYTSEDGDFGVLGHVAGNTTQGPGLIGSYMYEDYSMIQGGANVGSGMSADSVYNNRIPSNSDKHWYNINFKLNYKTFKWSLGFTDIYAGADGTEYLPYLSIKHDDINKNTSNYDPNDDSTDIMGNKVPMYNSFRFNRREFYTDLIYDTTFTDNLSFLSVISYRLNQYDFDNYAGRTTKLSNDPDSFANKIDYEPLQHKLYGLAQLQWRIYEANEFIIGLVLEYHSINSDKEFDTGITEGKRDMSKIDYLTPSIFIQDEQRFWDDRIILTLGARLDVYKATMDEPDFAPSGRFAFLGKWTDWMTMRISYGYAFKEPSLYQLYADSFDFKGNDSLKPETLHNVELSFVFTPTYFMKIRLDGFATYINDLIIVNYDPDAGNRALGIFGRNTPSQNSNAIIGGFEFSLDTAIGKHWRLYTHYNYMYNELDIQGLEDNKPSSLAEDTAPNGQRTAYKKIPNDAAHRFKLGATFMNDWVTADLAFFLVGGTPKMKSVFGHRKEGYKTPIYGIIQPQVTANVGANIGLMLQGSYAFSEHMLEAPTNRFYYEKEGIPVSRYSVMFSLIYPFKPER